MPFHLVPASPSGKWRLGLLLLVFVVLGCLDWPQCAVLLSRAPAIYAYFRYSPREGDVVFQSLPHGDLVDAIEAITHSPYSHCGVVLRDQNGKWVVIESIGDVHETPLFTWIFRGRGGNFSAYRLEPKYQPLIPSFKKALLGFFGYPYDFDYDMSHSQSVYCSDLVFLAFQKSSSEQLGKLERLGDLDWKGHRSFIMAETNGKLPLDRVMITPASLARAAQLHRVF